MRVEDETLKWLNQNSRDYWVAWREFGYFLGTVAIAMMFVLVLYVWGAPAG